MLIASIFSFSHNVYKGFFSMVVKSILCSLGFKVLCLSVKTWQPKIFA